MTEKNIQEYVQNLNEEAKSSPFWQLLQRKEPDLADLLQKMLQFNPYLRHSAKELLRHPYFAGLRLLSNEQKSRHKLQLEFDRDEAVDSKSFTVKASLDELKSKLLAFVSEPQ